MMSEKQTKNRLKDMIWDYYTTNREITKQNDAYNRQHPSQGWNGSAKLYVGIIIVGVVGIIIKYFVL